MPELELIGLPQSNFVWSCRIACGEKGVPYRLTPARPHTPEIDAIHPFGKMPAMRHGDMTLCESRAIIAYIDRAFPGPAVLPADVATAARVEQWASIAATNLDPVWLRRCFAAYIFPGTPDGSPDRAAIDAALAIMKRQFPVMERAVAANGHLAGPEFSLADIYFVPILFYMSKFPESAALLRQSPSLTKYLERQLQRKSIAKRRPRHFRASAEFARRGSA
ncbi:MAG: glutathione S-transferase family protein [Stellaceae bacterium]